MGCRSTLLIAILVFAILVPMIYYGTTVDTTSVNPTIPKQEALDIVEKYLGERVEGFSGVAQWCCIEDKESRGYMLKDEFLAKGFDLPMRYYHKNSTVSIIMSDEEMGNYTVLAKRHMQDVHPRAKESFVRAMSGHLAYVMDIAAVYDGQSIPTGGFWVDARSGEIIHTNFFCFREVMEYCKQDTPAMNS